MITWMALTPLHVAVGHLYMVYVLHQKAACPRPLVQPVLILAICVLWGCRAEFPLLQCFTLSWPWLFQHFGLRFCSFLSLRTNPCWNHLFKLFLCTVPSYSLQSSKGLLTCRDIEIVRSTAAVQSTPQGSQPDQKLVLFCFDQFFFFTSYSSLSSYMKYGQLE